MHHPVFNACFGFLLLRSGAHLSDGHLPAPNAGQLYSKLFNPYSPPTILDLATQSLSTTQAKSQ